jgi:DNA-binding NarL/FixJ family response regulator
MRVILADDSDLILDRLQTMVGKSQKIKIVGTYRNGIDTLEALRTLKPDLAIVDIKMPGMSGLEVLTQIRKENKALIFIVLTFFSMDYYRQLALEAGVDYFFSKIDDFEKITQVLDELAGEEGNGDEPELEIPPIGSARNTG